MVESRRHGQPPHRVSPSFISFSSPSPSPSLPSFSPPQCLWSLTCGDPIPGIRAPLRVRRRRSKSGQIPWADITVTTHRTQNTDAPGVA